VTCLDCGVPLKDADDEQVPFEARPRPGNALDPPPVERRPPEGYVPVYSGRDVGDVEPLAAAMQEAEIAFHVQETAERPGRSAASYSLYVPEPEAARARRVMAPLLGEGVDPEALDRSFDPEAGYAQCPACSAQIPGGAEACPDCGLGVSGDLDEEA
jgi:hypothetical protein